MVTDPRDSVIPFKHPQILRNLAQNKLWLLVLLSLKVNMYTKKKIVPLQKNLNRAVFCCCFWLKWHHIPNWLPK